jgi:hypothetical protein
MAGTAPAVSPVTTLPPDTAVPARSASWIKPRMREHALNPINGPAVLYIFHPGYKTHNRLLTIDADDNGAVDYDTARIFCGIICNNSFHGWFSKSANGHPRLAHGSPLQPGRVFFFVDEDPAGIFPSFLYFIHHIIPSYLSFAAYK